MRTSNTAKTGNAKVLRLGHTSGSQYGNNPRAQNPKRGTVRDETAK